MSKTGCADCNTEPRRLGSRCWKCYLRWSGRKYGFSKKNWWNDRFDLMQATLRGRYEMLALGEGQGDVWKTLLFIWPHRKGMVRPMWISHQRPEREKMLKLVSNLDRWARREHENHHRSEEA